MKNHTDEDAIILAKSLFGMVRRSQSGGYHVSIRDRTLDLSTEEFDGLGHLIQQVQMAGGRLSLEAEECLLAIASRGRFRLMFVPYPIDRMTPLPG